MTIQFFILKNTSSAASPESIAAVYGVPADVAPVVRKACNDYSLVRKKQR